MKHAITVCTLLAAGLAAVLLHDSLALRSARDAVDRAYLAADGEPDGAMRYALETAAADLSSASRRLWLLRKGTVRRAASEVNGHVGALMGTVKVLEVYGGGDAFAKLAADARSRYADDQAGFRRRLEYLRREM